jgi:hypothetical protein
MSSAVGNRELDDLAAKPIFTKLRGERGERLNGDFSRHRALDPAAISEKDVRASELNLRGLLNEDRGPVKNTHTRLPAGDSAGLNENEFLSPFKWLAKIKLAPEAPPADGAPERGPSQPTLAFPFLFPSKSILA